MKEEEPAEIFLGIFLWRGERLFMQELIINVQHFASWLSPNLPAKDLLRCGCTLSRPMLLLMLCAWHGALRAHVEFTQNRYNIIPQAGYVPLQYWKSTCKVVYSCLHWSTLQNPLLEIDVPLCTIFNCMCKLCLWFSTPQITWLLSLFFARSVQTA